MRVVILVLGIAEALHKVVGGKARRVCIGHEHKRIDEPPVVLSRNLGLLRIANRTELGRQQPPPSCKVLQQV